VNAKPESMAETIADLAQILSGQLAAVASELRERPQTAWRLVGVAARLHAIGRDVHAVRRDVGGPGGLVEGADRE
jgi:hypothetical protein